MIMDIRSEVKDLLEGKIDEVFVTFQDKLGIGSGDIDPWQAYRLDEQTDAMADIIADVLQFEIDNQGLVSESANKKCNECDNTKHTPEIVSKKEIK